jgi:hypothetical protein
LLSQPREKADDSQPPTNIVADVVDLVEQDHFYTHIRAGPDPLLYIIIIWLASFNARDAAHDCPGTVHRDS